MANRYPHKKFLTIEKAVEMIFDSGDEISEEDSDDDYVPPPSVEIDSDENVIQPDNIDDTASIADIASISNDNTFSPGSVIETGQKVITRHGVEWTPLLQSHAGRTNAMNVFKAKVGMSRAVEAQAAESIYSSWKLFINEKILRSIHKFTLAEGQKSDGNWEFSMNELEEAFIGLLYARGVYGKKHSVAFLWNKLYGPCIFSETMSREKYKKIQRYLRFDDKGDRRVRIETDKFTHVREIFHEFVENCKSAYTPNYSLTIDEQLLPMKNRCPFIVFMPNKPDKFGLKFWVLAEVENKYIVNVIPYLGAQEKESRAGAPLAESVVLKLVQQVKNKGYNVTTDNFFTSLPLAKKLKDIDTTIVGTVRANSKHLSSQLTGSEKGKKFQSKFYSEKDTSCLFVNYQCKENKNVCLLSTMHNSPAVSSGEKKKTAVVEYYNANKFGVDVVDQMLRYHSTRCSTRRWPFGVFCNILDMAALNAWILYRKATKKNMSRKTFLLQLVEALRSSYIDNSSKISTNDQASTHEEVFPQKKRRKCHGRKCSNATLTLCKICKNPTCGKCSSDQTKIMLVTCKNCYAADQ